jgi:hypothetical protein
MACTYGRGFAAAHRAFTEGNAEDVRRHAEAYAASRSASKEFGRFLDLDATSVVSATPIGAVDLSGRKIA